MKLLLDTCVWAGAGTELLGTGIDVIHIGDLLADPGDEEILRQAFRDGRVLVTLDKDFGELAVARAIAHVGIIRLVEVPARKQGSVCLSLLERYENDLARGAIITATLTRVRIRTSSGEDGASSGL